MADCRKAEASRIFMEQEKEMLNEIELERAVYDEVIWALNQNKNIKIEKGLFEDVEFCERRIKEEELKKDGVWKKKEMEVDFACWKIAQT